MFGKIIGGYLRTSNSSVGGYKPVVFTAHEEPPEGYYYQVTWRDAGDTIEQTWALEELPPEINGEEALAIIFGGDEV